ASDIDIQCESLTIGGSSSSITSSQGLILLDLTRGAMSAPYTSVSAFTTMTVKTLNQPIEGYRFESGGNMILNAGSQVFTSASGVSASEGSVSITGSDVNIAGIIGSQLNSSLDFKVRASGNISMGSVNGACGSLNIVGTGNVQFGSVDIYSVSSITGAQRLSLTGQNITITGDVDLATTGVLTVRAYGTFTMAGSSRLIAQDFDLSAYNTVSIMSSAVTLANIMGIETSSTSIGITMNTNLTAAGVVLDAGSVDIEGTYVCQSSSFEISSTTISSTQLLTITATSISLDSTGVISLAVVDMTTSGEVSITTPDDVSLNGTITSTSSSISVEGAACVFGDVNDDLSIVFTASNSLSLECSSVVMSHVNSSISASLVDVDSDGIFTCSGPIVSDDITISTDGIVDITGEIGRTSCTQVDISSSGADITLREKVNAGNGYVKLNGNNISLATTGGDGNVIADLSTGALTISALGDISGNANLSAATIVVTSGGAANFTNIMANGNVSISSTGNVSVNLVSESLDDAGVTIFGDQLNIGTGGITTLSLGNTLLSASDAIILDGEISSNKIEASFGSTATINANLSARSLFSLTGPSIGTDMDVTIASGIQIGSVGNSTIETNGKIELGNSASIISDGGYVLLNSSNNIVDIGDYASVQSSTSMSISGSGVSTGQSSNITASGAFSINSTDYVEIFGPITSQSTLSIVGSGICSFGNGSDAAYDAQLSAASDLSISCSGDVTIAPTDTSVMISSSGGSVDAAYDAQLSAASDLSISCSGDVTIAPTDTSVMISSSGGSVFIRSVNNSVSCGSKITASTDITLKAYSSISDTADISSSGSGALSVTGSICSFGESGIPINVTVGDINLNCDDLTIY
ncbi:hypothetical protein ADUPG1_010760, partial [Aduncisulcus paluster]